MRRIGVRRLPVVGHGRQLVGVVSLDDVLRYTTHAKLKVPAGTNAARASELLERAERGCLIANSLSGSRKIETQVVLESAAA